MTEATKGSYTDEIFQLVTFQLGNEEFAVNILNIQGINRMVQITQIPNAPEFVEGIINLRGKVIPIVDLRKRLGMDDRDYDNATRFIVVEFSHRVIGFIVDSVHEVLRINKNIIEPAPQMVAGIDADYITGVAKLEDRLLIMLDLEKVLTFEQKEVLNQIGTE